MFTSDTRSYVIKTAFAFPVDIGQEYMLDHVIEHNVSALYDKLNAND